jgi:hypothetical protein
MLHTDNAFPVVANSLIPVFKLEPQHLLVSSDVLTSLGLISVFRRGHGSGRRGRRMLGLLLRMLLEPFDNVPIGCCSLIIWEWTVQIMVPDTRERGLVQSQLTDLARFPFQQAVVCHLTCFLLEIVKILTAMSACYGRRLQERIPEENRSKG